MRQRILPGVLWMHPAIEQQPVPANLKIVRVRADLRAPSEINKFQSAGIVGRLCELRKLSEFTAYKISLRTRNQLPRRIFSISSSEKARSMSLRVKFRACEWFVRSGMKCGLVNLAARSARTLSDIC